MTKLAAQMQGVPSQGAGQLQGAHLLTQSTSRWNRCKASGWELDTICGKSISTKRSASSI